MGSIAQFLWKNPVVRLLLGLSLAALVLAGMGWLVTGSLRSYPAAFDSSIRTAIRQMQSPMWTTLFLTLTQLGSTLYLSIIGGVAGIAFIFLRWFRPLLILIVVMIGQAALHHGFKWLIERPRPSALINYKAIETFSFPSGHAIAALCLYGTIAWLIAVRLENAAAKAGLAIFSIVLIFLIGVSRAYIGIHHPTDVLAGFLAGAIWTAAVLSIDRRTL